MLRVSCQFIGLQQKFLNHNYSYISKPTALFLKSFWETLLHRNPYFSLFIFPVIICYEILLLLPNYLMKTWVATELPLWPHVHSNNATLLSVCSCHATRTRCRVNLHSIVAWMSRNLLRSRKQARNLKVKWLQLDSNSEPLSL